MDSALLIRLRPRGPWRYGPADGALDRVDTLFRSDRLFSALTLAMRALGHLDEWLQATARASKPAVTFSSLFPYQGDTLFAVPPATLWPPPATLVRAPNPVFLAKIRWNVARFVPLTVIDSLISGTRLLADQWLPDAESGCLLRRDRPSNSPFRVTLRRTAAVDRMTRASASAEGIACVEFEAESGLWTVARYADAQAQGEWGSRVEAAFRFLADTGFGGRRSSGWGQTHMPQFQAGEWPALLLPRFGRNPRNQKKTDGTGASTAGDAAGSAVAPSNFWLLSLYSPAVQDRIAWAGGEYEVITRAGRIENGAGSGQAKQVVRMIAEGSVLESAGVPVGAAVDVAPEGFAHPVFRSGLALVFELPATAGETPEDLERDARPVEEPTVEEAIIDRPCEDAPAPVAEQPENAASMETPASPDAAEVQSAEDLPRVMEPEQDLATTEVVERAPEDDPDSVSEPGEEHPEESASLVSRESGSPDASDGSVAKDEPEGGEGAV